MSNKKTFAEVLTESEVPVLVDFWAPWCGPCLAFAPVLEDFAHQYAGKIKVLKINVDNNQSLSQKYDIMSIPTIILFVKGEPVWRSQGSLSFSELKRQLQFYL